MINMGMDFSCGKETIKLINIFELLKYKLKFNKEHPNYFFADGLVCFTGAQGTGKTLSAVNYVYNLLKAYPMSKLVTNLYLSDYPIVTFNEFVKENNVLVDSLIEQNMNQEAITKILMNLYLKENRVFPFLDNDDLRNYDNSEFGVIFLIDEIQLYMNSLESKNINIDVMTQISQQRKQRKHIVCTSQVFGRMAKPLREQFSNVIVCKCYLNTFQLNKLVDRDSLESGDNSTGTNITGEVKKKFFWIHSPKMYKRYDTYYVIEKGKFVDKENQKGDLYEYGDYRLSNNN
jgi:hypothetical protein